MFLFSHLELAGEAHTNDLGALELPGNVGHDIDGISTTHTDAHAAKATAVGGVAVSADQQHTGVRVVLEDDLMCGD